MKPFLLLALLVAWAPLAVAAVPPPTMQWQRGFGTIYDDQGDVTVKQTTDGGYIMAGTQGDAEDSGQFWILRLDSLGNVVWQFTGGSSDPEQEDLGVDVVQMSDGGFVLMVDSGSAFSGVDTSKSDGAFGQEDMWVIRFDPEGYWLWDHTFGASGSDRPVQLLETPDGGLWLLGNTEAGTNGNRLSTVYGSQSWWFVRLDGQGNKLAERSFGGDGHQSAERFARTADGGFVLVGESDSGVSGNKTSPHFGSLDYWVVRVDAAGNKLWDKSFGGTGLDFALNVWETNGTIVVAGLSFSGPTGNKTNAATGFWLVGLDANGGKLWEQVLAADDMPYGNWRIMPTRDGGAIFGGTDYLLYRPDPQEPTLVQERNLRVARVNAGGQRIWQLSVGGNDEDDDLRDFIITRDGGLLLAGQSDSGVSGTKTVPNLGYTDLWLVKLWPDALNAPPTLRSVSQTTASVATNGCQVLLFGMSNISYAVERSLDFTAWLPFTTNRLSSNQVLIVDRAATNLSRAFYRGRVVP